MRVSIAAEILDEMCEAAKPGVSTWELDQIARAGSTSTRSYERVPRLRVSRRTRPCVCTSINEVIVHGIPRKNEVLKDGDIIGIDFGIFKHGFCADTARTVMVGSVSAEKRKLVETPARRSSAAIDLCRVGNRLGDIGHAVQSYAESHGYSVVRQFVGHGTGRQMHEDPQVPNYGKPRHGKRIKAGLVIAVEPMVNAGAPDVEVLDDDWTAVTKDRSHVRTLRAHDRGHGTRDLGCSPDRHQHPASRLRPKREVMKVRASVKPICPKCKVIKRKGVVRIICTNAAPQAASGLRGSHGTYRRRRPPA